MKHPSSTGQMLSEPCGSYWQCTASGCWTAYGPATRNSTASSIEAISLYYPNTPLEGLGLSIFHALFHLILHYLGHSPTPKPWGHAVSPRALSLNFLGLAQRLVRKGPTLDSGVRALGFNLSIGAFSDRSRSGASVLGFGLPPPGTIGLVAVRHLPNQHLQTSRAVICEARVNMQLFYGDIG